MPMILQESKLLYQGSHIVSKFLDKRTVNSVFGTNCKRRQMYLTNRRDRCLTLHPDVCFFRHVCLTDYLPLKVKDLETKIHCLALILISVVA